MDWHYWWLAPVGLVLGVVGTLIGAGGGFILMPVLVLLYPKDEPQTLAAISLAVVFFNALSGSAGYARQKKIDYRAGLWFAAAAVPASVLGAFVTSRLSRAAFDGALGVMLVAASAFLMLSAGREKGAEPEGEGPPRIRMGRGRLALGVGLSFLVGFVSSLLGIGGGIIHVPALVFLLKFPVHIATATSHFVLAMTAAAGTAAHVVNGEFHAGLRRTLWLSLGVVIGAQLGARLARRTPPVVILRGLAGALMLVGVRVLVQAWRA